MPGRDHANTSGMGQMDMMDGMFVIPPELADNPAVQDYAAAMGKTMADPMPYTGDADVDFVKGSQRRARDQCGARSFRIGQSGRASPAQASTSSASVSCIDCRSPILAWMAARCTRAMFFYNGARPTLIFPERKQGPAILDGEPKGAGAPEKGELVQFIFPKRAVAVGVTQRLDEADILVIADRLCGQA